MRGLVILVLGLVPCVAFAQTAQNPSLKGQPIEITATGGTNYVNGLATAHENVAIHIGDTDIYGDDATYNPDTHDVHVRGHARIYRANELYVGEEGVYNTVTKKISSEHMRTINAPFFVGAGTMTSISEDAKLVQRGSFTTDDQENPSFQIRARRMRIYEGDRVIMRDAVFYVGKVPIFYWPYLYQSLDDSNSIMVSPAYLSSWGASLLGRITFPIGDHIDAALRLDYRYKRGPALGFSPTITYGKNDNSFARINTYFVDDYNPTLNRTSIPRDQVDSDRYRLSVQDRTDFGNNWSGFATLEKLSDPYILQDFFPAEFRVDPQPDNVIELNHWSPQSSFTAFTRVQMNNFFDATERLPEVAYDVTRHPIFGTGINYESETSFDYLKRTFPSGSTFQDYSSLRLDTFHQFSYPGTYFGWLSVVPRLGFRATYYSETRNLSNVAITPNDEPLVPDFLVDPPSEAEPLIPGGDHLRALVNTGLEMSFKVSRTWEDVQSRALGLDGLRHIIQPFMDYSYLTGNNISPAALLQFDRYIPSTRPRPIDFPQFNSIDSLDNWNILRLGIRNRLQTRRDDATVTWLEMQTFFDVNFDNPYDKNPVSNLVNSFGFSPVPWASLNIFAQIPLVANSFTEVDTNVHFQPMARLSMNLGHRYLINNPFFEDSSLYEISAYYRLNDNWGLGGYARYEAKTSTIEEQRYTLYRDLTAWVGSVGAIVRDNAGVKEYGVLISFTLKALPKFSFDLNFDPGATGAENGSTGLGTIP